MPLKDVDLLADQTAARATTFGNYNTFFAAQSEQWEIDQESSNRRFIYLVNSAKDHSTLAYIQFQIHTSTIHIPFEKGEQQSEILRKDLLRIIPLDTSWGTCTDYELSITLPNNLNEKSAIMNLLISRFKLNETIASLLKGIFVDDKVFAGFASKTQEVHESFSHCMPTFMTPGCD